MPKRRANRPKLDKLRTRKPDSATSCWYCGLTRNVPEKKYDGLCLSCYMDFIEDDSALKLWKGVAA